jgi:phosphate transport system permease protein
VSGAATSPPSGPADGGSDRPAPPRRITPPSEAPELHRVRARPLERLAEALVRMAGWSAVVAVGLIIAFLAGEAGALFAGYDFVGERTQYPLSDFLTGRKWYPDQTPPMFGLVPLLAGSAMVTVLAMLIACPLGLAAATYLGEFCPRWLREVLKPLIEIIAAIPSVVIGFFGVAIVGPAVRDLFQLSSGLSALTGGLALAVMSLPTIVTIAEDAIAAVPQTLREAALGLGATRWQATWRVVLPAAAPGILAAVILGFGRVVGETMAVLMVTGNAAVIPTGPLDRVRTMTATIAAETGEAVVGSPHYRALFAIAAVLFAITLVINSLASWALQRARRRAEGRA